MAKTTKKVIGYISASPNDRFIEKFKGEVANDEERFPRELGLKHPYSFKIAEAVYLKHGLVNAIVNKYVDAIVGEFSVKVSNENARKIIEKFIKDTNLTVVIREWIREGIMKGNGFMELDFDDLNLRVLNANDMYVRRRKDGTIIGYNQYVGNLNKFTRGDKKLNEFKPNEIAHYKFNTIAGEAYGRGLIILAESIIENMILTEEDRRKLISRKAGAPIHVKVGLPGQVADTKAIDGFKQDLVYLNNRTEWVTDGSIDMKVIDFGNLGEALNKSEEMDFKKLIAATEVPEVLLGSGQLNEGIARVQLEGWQRTIAAKQEEIEAIIEQKIFKPILLANNLQVDVEFVWNLPSESEINARIEKLTTLLSNQSLSENMRRFIELEIAKLLNFEEAETLLEKPEKGAERKAEEEIPQPEVPGAKPSAKEKHKHNVKEDANVMPSESEMSLKEFVNLVEIRGFNYNDYLAQILKAVKEDNFEDVKAVTEKDVEMGKLSKDDVEKLRVILKQGFKNNETIKQIEKEISDNISLRDRISEDGKLLVSASSRPNMLARTETVRLANTGLVNLYKANKIERVRFLAAVSNRTCEQCEQLNGNVYEIANLQIGENQPPIHANCRCSLVGVVE